MKRIIGLCLAFLMLMSMVVFAAEDGKLMSDEIAFCGCSDDAYLDQAQSLLLRRKMVELQQCFVNDSTALKDESEAELLFMPDQVDIKGGIRLMPSTGTVKLLVIPVVYPDLPKFKENFDIDAQNRQFFAPYDSEKKAWLQSVKGYYQWLSYGQLNIEGSVMEPYEAPQRSYYYYDKLGTTPERIAELLSGALQYYIDQGIDLSEYDTDGDGHLDAVIIKSMRSYPTNYTQGFGAPVKVGNYEVDPYVFLSLTLYGNTGEEVDHTIRQVAEHEIGHLMGLKDNYAVAENGYNVLDHELAEMMESSDANNKYFNVYYKYLLGWVDPLVLTGENTVQDVTITPVEAYTVGGESNGENGPRAVVLMPNMAAFPFTEFYIAEYRNGGMDSPTGAKTIFADNPGVVIWHVNAALNKNNNYKNRSNYLQPVYKSGTGPYNTKDIYIAKDGFSAITNPSSNFYDSTYTGAYLKVLELAPDKAVLQAGFIDPDPTPEPIIEISPPSSKAIRTGQTSSVVVTVKLGEDLLEVDEDSMANIFQSIATTGNMGTGDSALNLKNPMTIIFRRFASQTDMGNGTKCLDIPAGIIRHRGKDSAAVRSEVVYVDNIPPEIKLLGPNPQVVERGKPYEEQGAEATDNMDPQIENALLIDSTQVDIKTVGSYTVYYSVTDHAGHTTTAERTVMVQTPLHIHSYSAVWCKDESGHWRECVCGAKADQASHTAVGDWHTDGTAHWKLCICGQELERDIHTGGTSTCMAKAVCNACGQPYGELSLSNHTGGTEIRDARPATCEIEGYTGDTYCKGCNNKLTSGTGIPRTDHVYGLWIEQDDIFHVRTCSVCGENTQGHIETQTHAWGEGTVDKEPTETETGVKTFVCSICNAIKSEDIPALEHTHHLVYVAGKDATCVQLGNVDYCFCADCGLCYADESCSQQLADVTLSINPNAHDWNDWRQKDENTHIRVCKNSPDHIQEQNHNWADEQDTICDECGYERDVIPPVPEHTHNWRKEWEKNATHHWHECGTENCTIIDNTEKDGYAAHAAASGWQADSENHWKRCECGFEMEKATHIPSQWIIDKAATSTTVGSQHKECTVCNYITERRTISVTGGSSGDSPSSGQKPCNPADKVPPIDSLQPEFSLPFTDVSEMAWYYSAVEYVTRAGLFRGTSESTFSPGNKTTRSMLVVVLFRLYGEPKGSVYVPFADVKNGVWYTDAIAWATEKGIVTGYNSQSFGPDDSITREQLAVMLWRYAGSPATKETLDSFTDKTKVSNYAQDALGWAVEQGIVTGKAGGILDPGGQATRAEVATMLMRFCESTKERPSYL